MKDKRQPEVGVDESGIDVNEEDVAVHGGVGEAEDEHRDDGEAAEGEDFEEMHSGTGHPVHALRGVMDGVEFPEPGQAVEGAMDPVLDEVGEKHYGQELNDEW